MLVPQNEVVSRYSLIWVYCAGLQEATLILAFKHFNSFSSHMKR